MISAVIFDMDGVLIDSEPLHKQIFDGFSRELGFSLSQDEYKSLIGVSSIKQWRLMCERFKLPGKPEDLSREKMSRYKHLLKIGDESVRAVPGALELISAIKSAGIPFAIASSNDREIIDLSLRSINIENEFDISVAGDEVENCKPAPDVYLKAVRLLNTDPEGCIAIEDSTNGVTAAKSAKMCCIGFVNRHSPGQNLAAADLRVTSLFHVNVPSLKGLVLKR